MRALRRIVWFFLAVLAISAVNFVLLAVVPTPPWGDLIMCVAVTLIVGGAVESRFGHRKR
jgi:ABC-type antimicrobial peptide transport system permease subunit